MPKQSCGEATLADKLEWIPSRQSAPTCQPCKRTILGSGSSGPHWATPSNVAWSRDGHPGHALPTAADWRAKQMSVLLKPLGFGVLCYSAKLIATILICNLVINPFDLYIQRESNRMGYIKVLSKYKAILCQCKMIISEVTNRMEGFCKYYCSEVGMLLYCLLTPPPEFKTKPVTFSFIVVKYT